MTFRVSVSDLVGFACRTGDLVNSGPAGPTAQQGIRAHQKLQAQIDPAAEAELAIKADLSADLTNEDFNLLVRGRIDIVLHDSVLPELYEIKSTLVPPERISEGVKLQHWAQLKVYGFLYLRSLAEEQLLHPQKICLKLMWYNLSDESVSEEIREFHFDELEAFTIEAVRVYSTWISKVESWRKRTIDSALEIEFPHQSFRSGQRDLAAACYRTIRDGGYLLSEAPTGIGKTISTLFPAVKAIGDGHTQQIVYLTAKTSGRAVAKDSLQIMKESGLEITSLIISSKSITCHCSNGTCKRNADGRCPLTLGFFDRLPAARDELISRGALDDSVLEEVASRYQVCPFELSLQMIPWVSVVICDYNYVFDPLVVLQVFAEPKKNKTILIDEAHNLVDRSRGMYSARLTRSQNRMVIEECNGANSSLIKSLEKLTRSLDRWAKACGSEESHTEELPKGVSKSVAEAVDAITGALDSGLPLPESARDWFRELFRYRVIEEIAGEHHRTVTKVTKRYGKKEVELKIMCVNATDKLEKTFKKFHSVSAFSATLRPLDYYYVALGLPKQAQTLCLPSPFLKEQLGCFVCGFIDTRFKVRSASEDPIAGIIETLVESHPGNYLVFFPSYVYMEEVYRKFVQSNPDVNVVKQERDFSLDEREHFLDQFSNDKIVLGFAIMGGVFGEGIDYIGDKLVGTVLVGTGLPGLGVETRLIAEDYTKEGLNGFDYTYRYPGFTKVLQTAGRVIRDEKDKGVVVLIDNRFTETFYKALYPPHWSLTYCQDQTDLENCLEAFWLQPVQASQSGQCDAVVDPQ